MCMFLFVVKMAGRQRFLDELRKNAMNKQNMCNDAALEVQEFDEYDDKSVNLATDLNISDDSDLDPDYQLPKKFVPDSDDESDLMISNLSTNVTQVALVEVHQEPIKLMNENESSASRKRSDLKILQNVRLSFNSDDSISILEDNSYDATLQNVENHEANENLLGSIKERETNGQENQVFPRTIGAENPKKRKGRSKKEKEDAKKQRNQGMSYVTEKGKKVPERSLKGLDSCRMKCRDRFPDSERKQLFEEYWRLGTRDRRAMFVSSLIKIVPKKTQKTDGRQRNRDCYCIYKLTINNDEKPICKECFRKTLGETIGFINTVIEKKKNSPVGIIPEDTRGRQPPKNKKTREDISEANNHIQSFPNYESHYCRKSTSKKFLSSDLSIAKMYRLYRISTANPISLKLYAQCFHDLNLSFKKPSKDTCHTCDLLNIKISLAEGEAKFNLEMELAEHHKKAEAAFDEKRKDKNIAKNDQSKRTYAFDLQQCLPTPYLKTSVSFYKRQLWSFNLTIHDLATDQGTCYMWDETIGARGANQIASCLWHFLWNLPSEVNEVTLYSDTCGGQNKNNIVALMLLFLVHLHPTLEVVNHKFLISGHSHMECDSDHAVIEKAKKSTHLKLNHLNDWVQLVRTCKVQKPFKVKVMSLDDFFNFADLSSKKGPFSIKKKDSTGQKFLWQPVKWLRYTKTTGTLYFKTTIDSTTPFSSINYRKKGKSLVDNYCLDVVSRQPLPISKEKKKDLMDLIPLIDPVFHEFYLNLKSNNDVNNTDPDLDEEDPDYSDDEATQ